LKAAAYGLPHVRFAGFRTQSELAAFYALADILVLPSLWESWGLVVNEAMNAGCAIVASDRVGSAHDLVQDGVNGYRVKPDPGQLAGCLQRLLQDPVMRRDMGKAGLAIINNWSFDQDLFGLRAALSATLANRQASSVPAATLTPRV
jgi:glycosyltransferase involved in cell wall biosynthesis